MLGAAGPLGGLTVSVAPALVAEPAVLVAVTV
jgi:hypothetical protein